jgi:hypothetical protein
LVRICTATAILLAATVAFSRPFTEPQQPDVFMPAHHDAAFFGHAPLWRATEPVFQALKDASPNLVTVSRGYREPVCFDTEINMMSQKGRH